MPYISLNDVIICKIKISEDMTWRFIILECADGLTGTGELTIKNAPSYFDNLIELICHRINCVPDAFTFHDVKNIHIGTSLEKFAIISALNQAIYDITAKQYGMPLYKYLCNTTVPCYKVPLYANVNRRTIERAPQSFAKSVEIALNQGFTAVKIAPFDNVAPGECHTLEGRNLIHAGFERVAAASERLQSGHELYIECHWRFTEHVAQEIINELSNYRVTWVECPIVEDKTAVEKIAAIRHVANEKGIRLAGGERLNTINEFYHLLDGKAYDVVMPDVKYVSNFIDIFKINEYARKLGTSTSLHNPTGPICHAMSVHLTAALDRSERLEVQLDETPLFSDIVDSDNLIQHGQAELPNKEGIGLSLIRDRLECVVINKRPGNRTKLAT